MAFTQRMCHWHLCPKHLIENTLATQLMCAGLGEFHIAPLCTVSTPIDSSKCLQSDEHQESICVYWLIDILIIILLNTRHKNTTWTILDRRELFEGHWSI